MVSSLRSEYQVRFGRRPDAVSGHAGGLFWRRANAPQLENTDMTAHRWPCFHVGETAVTHQRGNVATCAVSATSS